MRKNEVHKIKVSKEEFKKIKKGKQTFIIRLNNEENQKIKSKDKIIIIGKLDRFRKNVKEIHTYSTLEDLINDVTKEQLGYKKKETNYAELLKNYSDDDIKKYGILCIEIKRKKHVIRKILLSILTLFILVFLINFISDKIKDMKAKKFGNELNELAKDRIDYVFIEINPSFVLTVKDKKINDIACLNDDCLSFYKELQVVGKNIDDGIDNIYKVTKDKGFDTSKKIKVKTTGNIKVKKKEHIEIEYISNEKQEELLSEIKNKDNIKPDENNSYYDKLWDKLKKDSEYDKVYSCNMNKNELECYIKKDFVITKSKLNEKDSKTQLLKKFNQIKQNLKRIEVVLKKFGFDIRPDNEVPIVSIPAGRLFVEQGNLWLNDYDNIASKIYYEGKIRCDMYTVYLTDINLLKPNNIPFKKYVEEEINIEDPVYENKIEYNDYKFYTANYILIDENKVRYYCDYHADERYGDYKQEITHTYKKCDKNEKNCKEISKEEYSKLRDIKF